MSMYYTISYEYADKSDHEVFLFQIPETEAKAEALIYKWIEAKQAQGWSGLFIIHGATPPIILTEVTV